MSSWGYLVIAAALFTLGGAVGSGITEVRWDAKYQRHLRADAVAVNKAVEEARKQEREAAAKSEAAAVNAAKADRQIEVQTRTLVKEVPRYVTAHQDAVGCVTYGLLRVYDAAILGVEPSTLELPAGKSDDACSPVKPSDLGRSLADNVGVSRQNAAQLDALIANVRETVDLYNGERP